MEDSLSIVCLVTMIVLSLVGSIVGPPVYAFHRGYSWYKWIPGGGIFGLVLLAALPSIPKSPLLAAEQIKLRQRGDRLGLGLTVVSALAFLALCAAVLPIVIEQQRAYAKKVFESKHYPVRVTYRKPWELSSKFTDTPAELRLRFIDARNRYIYGILYFQSAEGGQYSPERHRDLLLDQWIDGSPANRIVDEGRVQFHGAPYYRIRFDSKNAGMGVSRAHHYVRLPKGDGLIEIVFPIEHVPSDGAELPELLLQFDKQVELNAANDERK